MDKILHAVLPAVFVPLCSYHYRRYTPKSRTFLLVANHTTDYDMFLQCFAVPGYIRFVASENIFLLGPVSRVISHLARPIRKRKGADSRRTIEAVEENLRLGISVGIEAEGNKSFNGETGYISPRTGQMVKESAGGLITFRIRGGYLKKPRWARCRRRGPTFGEVVHEYTRGELDRMTAEEINAAIRRDLYVNAYEDQRRHPVPYPGRSPAEHLETALYACPACGRLQTLHSRGDTLSCGACGYSVRLNRYGFFEGADVRFPDVLQWDKWQREALRAAAAACTPEGAPLLRSSGQEVFVTENGRRRRLFGSGEMRLYADRLELEGEGTLVRLPLRELSGMGMFLATTLMAAAPGRYYQIKSKTPRSSLAYFAAYRYLTDQAYV